MSPKLLMCDPTIISIHCGAQNTAIYKEDGSLLVFGFLVLFNFILFLFIIFLKGYNSCGKIYFYFIFIFVLFFYFLFLFFIFYIFFFQGQLGVGSKTNVITPTCLIRDQEIKKICLSYYHSMYLRNNGDLYAMGKK